MVDKRQQERGARIAEAIENAGISQRKVASLVGVTPQSVTKWIRTGNIQIDNLEAFSRITRSGLRYLITGQSDLVREESRVEYQFKHKDLHRLVDTMTDPQAKLLTLCANAVVENGNSELDVTISIGKKKITYDEP